MDGYGDYKLMEFEQLLIEIAQGLSVCNQELDFKKEQLSKVKKFNLSEMMKITQECGEINFRRDKLIEDFIEIMLGS